MSEWWRRVAACLALAGGGDWLVGSFLLSVSARFCVLLLPSSAPRRVAYRLRATLGDALVNMRGDTFMAMSSWNSSLHA